MKKKSNTSQCSQESEDLNSESKIQVAIKGKHEAHNVYNPKGIAPTVREMHGKVTKIIQKDIIMKETRPQVLHTNVLDSPRLTNTQTNSSPKDFQTSLTSETAQKLKQINFQTLICSVEDFLANHSQSLEKGKVLMIPEARCFLKLQEFLKLKDLKLYCLKTSRAYSVTKKAKLSLSSWKRWMNWGMIFNGWYLTANFSESPRTEKGCSLSDIGKILNI